MPLICPFCRRVDGRHNAERNLGHCVDEHAAAGFFFEFVAITWKRWRAMRAKGEC